MGGLQRNWGTAAKAESGECGVHTRKSLGNNPLGCSKPRLVGRGTQGIRMLLQVWGRGKVIT